MNKEITLLNDKFSHVWRKTTPEGDATRFRVLVGGRASGKSYMFATMAIYLASKQKRKFICLRMQQNRIQDSVYTLLVDRIDAMKLAKNFKINNDKITCLTTGSTFVFYGYQRNAQEIKSFEGGQGCICWFEEAQSITAEVFNLVRPTIMRNENCEMWFSFNPDCESDFSYQRLVVNPPSGSIVEKINYYDNIYLSPQAIADIEAQREEDPELFKNIYLGIPKTDDELAIIKRSWIDAAIDAHNKLGIDMTGAKIVGYDVADDGGDRNVCAIFNGSICVDIDVWKAGEDELSESALRAYAHTAGHDNAILVYDSCGVGAHVGSTVKKAGGDCYHDFVSAGAVVDPDDEYLPNRTNKEHFENLKAQAWAQVADRFRNTFNAVTKGMIYAPDELIAIDANLPNLEVLARELSTPRASKSARGLFKVESKQDVKKRLKTNKSPDMADAFVMGASSHLTSANAFDFTKWF